MGNLFGSTLKPECSFDDICLDGNVINTDSRFKQKNGGSKPAVNENVDSTEKEDIIDSTSFISIENRSTSVDSILLTFSEVKLIHQILDAVGRSDLQQAFNATHILKESSSKYLNY